LQYQFLLPQMNSIPFCTPPFTSF